MTRLSHAALALLALCATSAANAIPINFNISGEVTFADPLDPTVNDFGITLGDTITGTAFIPDADLLGAQTYTPAAGGLELVFNIGNFSFTADQDAGFPDFPTLDILDGVFVNLNFFVFDELAFVFSAFDGLWIADSFEGLGSSVAGTYTVAATAVPEPGTLALLAIGVIALGLIAVRKR
jgi:hypothetical protein